ncbi:MAG TPA: hypothetical protein DCP92_25145 [Nitrospiraceae bacterium]|jgi:hypothetical protein|nr:hypothetical protein [Nitrospiraceae bacterium]
MDMVAPTAVRQQKSKKMTKAVMLGIARGSLLLFPRFCTQQNSFVRNKRGGFYASPETSQQFWHQVI